MKYVGRYNNGSNFMEWAGRPVDSIEAAKSQVDSVMGMLVDVVQVPNGRDSEGSIVATGDLDGWKDSEAAQS